MLRIKKASYVAGYKIKILFSDGKTKIVDFEKWIFSDKANFYLDPLKDKKFFKGFVQDEFKYTICWPNGADFSPDVLYRAGKQLRKSRSSNPLKNKTRARKSKSSKI